MTIRGRHRIRKQVERTRRVMRPWPARVGDGNGTIEVPGQPNLWYVREWGSELPIPVYRGSAPRQEGYPVWVGQDVYNKRWLRILGIDYERAVNGGVTVTEVGPHATSHLYNGSDPAYIDVRQVVNVLAYASTEMTVHVNAGWVIIDGQPVKIISQNVDMTASIPASGAAYSIIRANNAGTLSVVDGTPVVSLIDLDDSDAPAFADGYAAIALVRLWFGMTELSRSATSPDVTPLYLAQISGLSGGVISAADVTVDTTDFNGNLSATDDDVQTALETLDDLTFIYGAIVAMDNVSNPPTETELITAFGTPDTFADAQKIGVLNDAASGTRAYCVLSDGGHYWTLPLARVTGTTLSVSVAATTVLATDTGQWFGRATMELLNDGTWVLVYLETTAHTENDVEVVHIRFSDDYGATWTDEDKDLNGDTVTIGLPTGGGTSDPYGPGDTYIFQALNGDLWLHTWKVDYSASLMDGSWRTKSTDNGKTWGAWEKIAWGGITGDDDIGGTEQHFILGSDIYLAGRIYQTKFSVCKIILFKSTDNGATWTHVSDVTSWAENTHEVAMEYLGNNTILTFHRDTNNTKAYKRISTDLGVTWGTLTEVQSDTTLGVLGRNRLYTRAHIKGYNNWWTDSVLVMCGFELMNPGSSQTRRNAIWISQDRGTTWTKTYIDTQTEDSGYGDMLYDPVNDQWVIVNYDGTLAEAELKQYNVEASGI